MTLSAPYHKLNIVYYYGMKYCSILLLCCACLANAQFGQNKLQYAKKPWSYIKSTHFDIYYSEKSREIADFAADHLEKSLAAISRNISYNIKKRIPVIIYKSHADFEQTNVLLDDIGEGTGGFTEILKSRIVIPFTGSYKDFEHVLHHELTHAVMFDLIFENVFNALRYRASFNIPLWAAEGWAEHESAGWNLESDAILMDAVVSGYLAEPRYNFGSMYMAYKGGMAFFNFMTTQFGNECVGNFIKYLNIYKDVDKAFVRATRMDLKRAGELFLLDLKKKYWPELGQRDNAEEVAKRLTRHRPAGIYWVMPERDPLANFNIQPTVSPDGKYIAYFSDRDDFVGIYIMDSRTGKIVRRLAQAGSSGQFESFHFYDSGIAWSEDGKTLMFVTQSNGQDVLRVISVTRGAIVQTLPVRMDRIESPDWSRDGRYVVFSGFQNAMVDLYLFDLKEKKLKKLTADKSYETRPRFSSDAEKIVFEAEYGAASAKSCNGFDIFIMNRDGTNLKRVTSNPFDDRMACFSDNDSLVYFISNRSGISNIYVTRIDSVSPRPITNFYSGCFTPSLPRDNSFMVFSVFENGGWDIYRMENPLKKIKTNELRKTNYLRSLVDSSFFFWDKRNLPPDPADTTIKDTAPAAVSDSGDTMHTAEKDSAAKKDSVETAEEDQDPFYHDPFNPYGNSDPFSRDPFYAAPRRQRRPPPVDTSAFLHDSFAYKDNQGNFIEHPYTPRFTVDAVSAMIGAGAASATDWAVGGQTAISLSDILGSHRIAVMANLYGASLDNMVDLLSYYVAYGYLPYRTDFFAAASRYVNPFVLQRIGAIPDTTDPDYYYLWYFDAFNNATVNVSYPFSKYLRLESTAGFDLITRTAKYYDVDSRGEKYLAERREADFYHTTFGIDGVFDNTLWGATGPVNGQRLRLSGVVVPPLGNSDFSYGYVIGDARRYFHFLKKYVVALRLTGGASMPLWGGTNPKRFYLGGVPGNISYFFMNYFMDTSIESNYYSSIVMPLRGYAIGAANPGGNTKFMLSNMEFRFPFIENISLYFPLPISINYIMGSVFWDAGAAWNSLDDFNAADGSLMRGRLTFDDMKSGVGFGLRMNLFGALVLKWDHAYRLGEHHLSEDYFSLGAEF